MAGWGRLRRQMADPSDTIENLSIRCPKCRQRFSMDSSLEGRMVECGACDARFRIDGDVIMRPRKFYPGERAGAELDRFRRVPISAAPPVSLEPMRYAEFNHPE